MSNKSGGLAVGESHDNGGIDFVVQGRAIEIEGDEIAVCKEAYFSNDILDLEGTPYTILMKIQKKYGCNTGKLTAIEPGQYVICKRVVKDHEVLHLEGTVKHIVNVLQAMGGCVVNLNDCDGACDKDKKEDGGIISNNIGPQIKKLISSNKAYEILDADKELEGSTWAAGGCYVLARAIHKLYGGKLVFIKDGSGIAQHVMVKFGDKYLDSDGLQTATQKIKTSKQELVNRPTITEFNITELGAIGIGSEQTVNKILKLLSSSIVVDKKEDGGQIEADHYPFYGHVLLNQFESLLKGSPILTNAEFCFLKEVYSQINSGVKFRRPQLDKIAASCGMTKFRSIKELTELCYVILYRNIALDNNLSVDEKYERIIAIYENQTTLRFGDQDTIILQQYSTPGPISYLLGQWCLDQKQTRVVLPAVSRAYKKKVGGGGYKAFKSLGNSMEEYHIEFADGYEYSTLRFIDREDAIEQAKQYYYPMVEERNSDNSYWALEPSAGNGLLTLALDPAKVIVNELDPLRNSSLQLQGYDKIYNQDAMAPLNFIERNDFDIVLSNPPFEGREPVKFDGFALSAMEHIMIGYALQKMAPNGVAAFVIGGHTKYDLKGRLVGRDKLFLQFLSKSYKLLDVINVDGSLYAKQGTKYPIRVLLIGGKLKSDKNFPLYKDHQPLYDRFSPQIIYNFMDLKKRIYGSNGGN